LTEKIVCLSHLLFPTGMPGNKSALFFIIFLFIGFGAFAQKSRAQLEREKEETLKKIKEAEKILKQTESERQVSVGQLQALNQQIAARQQLIASIDLEIHLLNEEIKNVSMVVGALEHDLEDLKKEYGEMVYNTYKINSGFNNITFLFSAKTFNQFFRRMKYMEQYSLARKNQMSEIGKVKMMLQAQIASIEAKNQEKIALRAQQEKENRELLSMRGRQTGIVKQLQTKENEVKKELAQSRKAVERVDAMISDIVRREMEMARKAAEGSRLKTTITHSTSSFEASKSRLDWPVSSGFISSRFGQNPHPVFSGITENNDGVSIQTNKNEVVNVVFDGVVTKVALAPPPFYQVVLVQHGEYYTVYSKLSEVYVKSGQTVVKGQRLGKVYTDKNGISEMHFMVWKNIQKLNPQDWLVKK
jgi:murein hydrolase activator